MCTKIQHASITESDIIHYFRNSGDNLAAESAVVEEIIRTIALHGEYVDSKKVILHLIAELKRTTDAIHLDILRNALDVIVGRTPDDDGI